MTNTPQINPDHPRIKNRTPEEQKRRDELAQILRGRRAEGEAGKLSAEECLVYRKFDKASAKKLIERKTRKDIEYVIYNLGKFKDSDHKEIAKLIIENGEGRAVVHNFEKFKDLDPNEIAKLLLKKGDGALLSENLRYFKDLDSEIAKFFIDIRRGRVVSYYLEKFKDLDYEVAKYLIEEKNPYREGKHSYHLVADNIEKFKGLDLEKIANFFIKNGKGLLVARNLDKFKGLNVKQAKFLIEEGYAKEVEAHLDSFRQN